MLVALLVVAVLILLVLISIFDRLASLLAAVELIGGLAVAAGDTSPGPDRVRGRP